MRGEDEFFERGELFRHELETQPKFLHALDFAFPAEKRDNRPLDLHARSQPGRNDIGGEALGLGTGADRGPRNEHGAASRRLPPGRKPGNSPLTHPGTPCVLTGFHHTIRPAMRDDYIKDALKTIPDPNILINVVSRRVKQLKRGNRPLVESLEKLTPEDTALREIIEGKISHELAGA
jgi:DNA-directed RNA polymerase subunit omega